LFLIKYTRKWGILSTPILQHVKLSPKVHKQKLRNINIKTYVRIQPEQKTGVKRLTGTISFGYTQYDDRKLAEVILLIRRLFVNYFS
jgi:hypothetical protein